MPHDSDNALPPAPAPVSPPRTAIIACAVLEDEVRAFAAGLPHITSLTFLPQGLHNEPARLNTTVAGAVAAVEAEGRAEAIALVYGVCSRGIEAIPLRRCRMVVPRAHDCITLLLGSKERYQQFQQENPATYWYSPGWNKCHAAPGPDRFAKLRDDFLKKFPEEEADYLIEMEKELHAHYTTAAYVDLGVGDADANIAYTRRCACWMGWDFRRVQGDPRLLRDLLAGRWDDDRFLVVQPRQFVQLSIDDRVIKAVDEPPAGKNPKSQRAKSQRAKSQTNSGAEAPCGGTGVPPVPGEGVHGQNAHDS
ncbi:DUF1638 domain-containing protein [Termitidicoccus mucosus]|uniref:DUF1638 domain-containing protein n=1 Tax=Termitidicoccus mucosus TaxID=1184151 RepID=A0A178ICM5_9BACT|nr:hypothetical protein AW736_22615 [Opitutaceae bacterium TSB47]